jgi:hypothetical protein
MATSLFTELPLPRRIKVLAHHASPRLHTFRGVHGAIPANSLQPIVEALDHLATLKSEGEAGDRARISTEAPGVFLSTLKSATTINDELEKAHKRSAEKLWEKPFVFKTFLFPSIIMGAL